MTGTQNRNPFEQLGDLIDQGNRRTLVIRGKNRVITTLPLGWAVVAGIALLITAWPVLLVALVILQYSGGSFAIEDAAPTAQSEPPAPDAQPGDRTP
jgi:hypothetical protein